MEREWDFQVLGHLDFFAIDRWPHDPLDTPGRDFYVQHSLSLERYDVSL